MNTLEKIKNSWWVILSFIMFLNGFGFIYIGTKHYNKNWILEGIIYELPWFIYFVIYANYGAPIGFNITATLVFIALILLFISIITYSPLFCKREAKSGTELIFCTVKRDSAFILQTGKLDRAMLQSRRNEAVFFEKCEA